MDYQLQSSYTERPSLFELFAQDELTDLLQPAVKYVLSVSLFTYNVNIPAQLPTDSSYKISTVLTQISE